MPSPQALLTADRVEAMAAGLRRLSGASGEWSALTDRERAADRACAAGIGAHVELLGLTLRRSEPARARPLTEEQVERAAVAEHERWMTYTRGLGYRWGPTRDDVALTHPDLVPWDDLDEPTRDKDRERVRAIPSLLASVGLELAVRER